MAARYKPLQPTLAKELAVRGEARARSRIRSRQLRQGLYKQQYSDTHWALVVPHFWAKYQNTGRPPVSARPGGVLIWFRNPKDDPRLFNGRTPERMAQTRKLTKAEFRKWSAINRKKIQAYKQRSGKKVLTQAELESLKLPMIVAKKSPRSGQYVQGDRFFENGPGDGMSGFREESSRYVQSQVSSHVRSELSRNKLWNAKKSVTVRF